MYILGYFMSVYCSSPHHSTNMANVPRNVGVFWPSYAYMEGIWVLKPWSNSFFDVVAAYFWMALLGMEIWHVGRNAMFVSGGKNKVCMRDHDPWFIPYGYGMDDWVVSWCTMLVLETKEKLKLFIISIKLHWRICEIKMIPIRTTLVKWWWTTITWLK